jgi:hypothetical protein
MDVVGYGTPDAPRRRWPLAAGAVLLLVGGAYGATRATAPRARTAAPAPAESTTPPPPLETVPVEDVPDVPYEAHWSLGAAAQPTRVVLTGPSSGLDVMDVDTGDVTPVQLGFPTDVVEPVASIDRGWVFFTGCGPGRPCGQHQLYAVRAGRVTKIGAGDEAMVDPVDHTVWLTTLLPERSPSYQVRAIEHRSLSGALLAPGRRELAPDESLLGVTARGAVVAAVDPSRSPVTLLDRGTYARRVLTTGPIVAVARDDVLTASPGCDASPATGCRLVATDVATGRHRDVTDLPGRPNVAAADPSGRLLAVAFDGIGGAAGVVDLREGSVTDVGGVTTPPVVSALAWTPDGQWLVLTHAYEAADYDSRSLVALWRLGSEEAVGGTQYGGIASGRFVAAYAR